MLPSSLWLRTKHADAAEENRQWCARKVLFWRKKHRRTFVWFHNRQLLLNQGSGGQQCHKGPCWVSRNTRSSNVEFWCLYPKKQDLPLAPFHFSYTCANYWDLDRWHITLKLKHTACVKSLSLVFNKFGIIHILTTQLGLRNCFKHLTKQIYFTSEVVSSA